MSKPPLPFAQTEQSVLRSERRRVLMLTLPVVATILLVYSQLLRQMAGTSAWEPFLFGGAAAGLIALLLLERRGQVSTDQASLATIAALALVLLERIYQIHTSGQLADPDHTVFMPAYAYCVGMYLLTHLMLPYPLSLRVSLSLWLCVASFSTWMLWPYIGETPERELLPQTLLYLWLGHGFLMVLQSTLASRQRALISQFVEMADAQRDARRSAQDNARLYSGVFNQAAVGIALLDSQGRWLEVNQKICEITGYSKEELLQLDFQAITHPDDLKGDEALAGRVIRHELDSYAIEKRYLRKDGSVVWIDLHVGRLDGPTREQDRFISAIQDISERKTAEGKLADLRIELEQRVRTRTAQLQDSNARWQERSRVIGTLSEMTGLLPSARDPAEACRIAALYMPRLFALTRGRLFLRNDNGSHLPSAHWGALADMGLLLTQSCWGLRRGQAHTCESGEAAESGLRCSHVGPHCGSACLPLMADGQAIGLLTLEWDEAVQAPEQILLRTLAEQLALALANASLREQLQIQALTDPLTGLGNRRHFSQQLDQALAAARRNSSELAVLMLDVDHFKSFNDRMGHDAGDWVLRETARVLRESLRGSALCCRYGGEEFIVLLPATGMVEASACAERVRAAVAGQRLHHQSRELPPVTVSVGVASARGMEGLSGEQLVREADEALYRAKKAGRNCVKLTQAA